MRLASRRPTKRERLFLYLIAISLLTRILHVGQDVFMDLLVSGQLFRGINDRRLQLYIVLANIVYGLAIGTFLWFLGRYRPAVGSGEGDTASNPL